MQKKDQKVQNNDFKTSNVYVLISEIVSFTFFYFIIETLHEFSMFGIAQSEILLKIHRLLGPIHITQEVYKKPALLMKKSYEQSPTDLALEKLTQNFVHESMFQKIVSVVCDILCNFRRGPKRPCNSKATLNQRPKSLIFYE